MKKVLDELAAFGAERFDTLTPAEAREAPTPGDAVKGVLAKRNEGACRRIVGDVSHRSIPGPGGDLPVRIYTPKRRGPLPVIVYYHGGGWVIANLDVYDAGARALAKPPRPSSSRSTIARRPSTSSRPRTTTRSPPTSGC